MDRLVRVKGIDKNVVLLGWVSFFTDLATAMVTPVLPIFIVTVLHAGMEKLGIIVAVATFVSYILRLFSGYLSDRYGLVKPLVVGGYLLSAISKPLIGLTSAWQSVAGLRALERLGKGLRSAPKDLLIAEYAGKHKEGKTFGFHKTMDIAGEFSGTLLLFFLLWYFGTSETVIRNIFLATLIPGMTGVLIMAFFVKDAKKPDRTIVKFLFTARDRETVRILIPYFFFLFFVFSDSFFTIQAKNIGISTILIPLLFLVSAGVQTLSSYIIGLGVDRFGSEKIIYLGYFSAFAAQLLLWVELPAATWISYAFLGIFTVSTLNAVRAMIAHHADNRASVYGIVYAGIAFFGAMGAWFSGWIWERFGMQNAILFSLGGMLLVLLHILIEKSK